MKSSEREKTPIDDRKIHSELQKYREIINKESNEETPEQPFLKSYNELFDFFEETYNKNMKLLEILQDKNTEIIKSAATAKKVINSNDSNSNEIQKLKEEFSRALSEFEVARSDVFLAQSKINDLRYEIQTFQKKFDKTPEEKENEAEITNLKDEISSNQQKITDLESQILTEKELINNAKQNFSLFSNEIETIESELQKIETMTPVSEIHDNVTSLSDLLREEHEKTKELAQQIEQKTEDVNRSNEENIQHQLTLKNERLVCKMDQRNKFAKKLEEMQNENKELERKKNKIVEAMHQKRDEIEQLNKKLETLNHEHIQFQDEYKISQQEYHEKREMKRQIQQELKEIALQQTHSETSIIKQESANQAASIRIAEVQKNIEREGFVIAKQKQKTEDIKDDANRKRSELMFEKTNCMSSKQKSTD